MTPSSNQLLLAGVAVCFLLLTPAVCKADTSTIEVQAGDTFVVDLPLQSRFSSWELESFSSASGGLSLVSSGRSSAGNKATFEFQATDSGRERLLFKRVVNTALVDRPVSSDTVYVTVSPEPTEPDPGVESAADDAAGSAWIKLDYQQFELPSESLAVSDTVSREWGYVTRLMKRDRLEPARQVIEENIEEVSVNADEDNKALLRFWREKLALSHYRANDYEAAVEVWNDLRQSRPNGPLAKWLYLIARARRQNDRTDRAELDLLEIRHRYRNSIVWPLAMVQLGDLFLSQNLRREARSVLEAARQKARGRYRGKVLLKLAELYDSQESIRDFKKAERYYRQAARLIEQNRPEQANAARKRANYLVDNFLQYGINQ